MIRAAACSNATGSTRSVRGGTARSAWPGPFRRIAVPALAALLIVTSPADVQPQSEHAIRVPLTRQDDARGGIGAVVTFEPDAVRQTIERLGVRLPAPMPAGARVGVLVDDVVLILHALPERPAATLIVDANMNRDLTDDAAIDVRTDGADESAVVVRIKRSYPGPPPSEAWLPYRFSYRTGTTAGGKWEPEVFATTNYRMDGTFTVDGRSYVIELSDYNLHGRFDRSNLSRGTVLRFCARDESRTDGTLYQGHELMPVGDDFYEVRDGALDGSWVELVRSTLPRAMAGRPLPDFDFVDTHGRRVRAGDFRGRYLLLDFWPSWCAPCVKQFDTIRKTVAAYAGRPFAVLGINLDSGKALDTARKIIAEKALSWPQVLPDRGYFLPLYQALGRLPEHQGAFPLYVLVGPDGRIVYATNGFHRMQRYLEAALAAPARPTPLFVALTRSELSMKAGVNGPVDLSSQATRILLQDPRLTLPPSLPDEARLGRLPNGMLVLARPGANPQSVRLRVAGNGDLDLSDEPEQEVPVLASAPATAETARRFTPWLSYAGGGKSFMPLSFFARPPDAHAADLFPAVYYWGFARPASGTFAVGESEYRIDLADSTPDGFYSREDMRAPGFLTLKQKKSAAWVTVHAGAAGIPIGGRLYHVRDVDDDGLLVILEVK